MDKFGILVISVILISLFLKKYNELSRFKELVEHVSWCMTEQLDVEISISHVKDLVSPAYRLNSDDFSFVETILDAYKEDLSHALFKNHLSSSKNIIYLQNRDYFFLTLKNYLEEHHCESYFLGSKMHDQLDIKYYTGDGSKETCQFTPFGIAYIKLLYLASVYCISRKSINSNHVSLDSVEYIKREIDSGIITISRYRP